MEQKEEMKTITYIKRGITIKGHFPLLTEILRLEKLNEPYWERKKKQAIQECEAKIKKLYGKEEK